MECKFVVGQKVVCISSSTWRAWTGVEWTPPRHGPTKNSICKIIGITTGSFPHIGEVAMLAFAEFPEERYVHRSFRPLQDRPKEADTDITIFNPLLKTTITTPLVKDPEKV